MVLLSGTYEGVAGRGGGYAKAWTMPFIEYALGPEVYHKNTPALRFDPGFSKSYGRNE